MFNIFKRKQKKMDNLPVETEQQAIQRKAWMEEIGVSKMYTKFKPFEDPSLVTNAPAINVQEKILRIRELHREYQNSLN